MANRIDSLLCGLGSPVAVLSALRQNLKDKPEIAADVQALYESLSMLLADSVGTKAAYAVVAAILNQNIMESSRVYRVTDGGRLDANYVSSKGDLAMWASLIAD